jgi:hypothetical protein
VLVRCGFLPDLQESLPGNGKTNNLKKPEEAGIDAYCLEYATVV